MDANDLINLLAQTHGQTQVKDPKNYRYVLYVRKSTDDKERQTCSLPDQIKECKQLAKSKSLRIVDILPEKQSAKEPDIRPVFRQMINDVKKGKYDGIIAWHPDRLARNMKEAGEIIDLIDKDIIKDLQFASFSFMNTASGKMLLGFQFVMSKEYSDKLSDDVKRGNRNRVDEGKYIGDRKHGYFRDKNQYLRPDGVNFELIQQAWIKRKNGQTLDEIADYLNAHNYEASKGLGGVEHTKYLMRKKILSPLFKDPLYAGVLIYGNEDPVNLLDKDIGFVPMVSVDDFFTINKDEPNFKKLKSRIKGLGSNEVKADFLRGIVFCEHCGESMSTGISSKKNAKGKIEKYFYFRCETEGCKYKNKSARGKVVREFVENFLFNNKFAAERSYSQYKKEIYKLVLEKEKELKGTLLNLNKKETEFRSNLESTKEYIKSTTDQEIRSDFENEYKKIKKELEDIAQARQKINDELKINKEAILTSSEFLELLNDLPRIIHETIDFKLLDSMIKKIFSNFYISFEEGTGLKSKIVRFELKEPFKSLLKDAKVPTGRGGGT